MSSASGSSQRPSVAIVGGGVSGLTAAYVLSGSMARAQLAELWSPGLDRNWMTDVYAGALPLVAALWLLVTGPGRRERIETALWCAIGSATILACLSHFIMP